MMKARLSDWLWVGLGGATGTLARGGIAEFFSFSSFPTGTLIVNLVGSLLLGGFTAYLFFRKITRFIYYLASGFVVLLQPCRCSLPMPLYCYQRRPFNF